ncbi:hypothetical protein CHS0354_022644 [Potamilus streckersoni]|uniref:DNA polymerase V n=1 Tax=Potamilus streckersoni TaxID=2493646 RepID=A0AAE0TGZ2_9BIVA|nr:hypothetical protein CHS0354_022644 [Potamilus streckersoni]
MRMRNFSKHGHMFAHMESTESRRPAVDPAILNIFVKLAEGSENERIKATENLIELLISKQSKTNEPSQELKYTVNRLVKGLASSRKWARLGFSVALCQVLRKLEEITVEDILQRIKENLKPIPSSQSKSEVGNILLGKAFAYLVLVQSGRITTEDTERLGEVVKGLTDLRKTKSYLQQLCVTGIVQILQQVDNSLFCKYVLPEIEAELKSGWVECSPDTLLLILQARKHHKRAVRKFLKEYWQDRKVVSEKNYSFIGDVVKASAVCHPLVHPVIDQLIDNVTSNPKLDLLTFWDQVVKPLFDESPSRRQLGLYMFMRLLPSIKTPQQMEGVISPALSGYLFNAVHKKGDEGLTSAKVRETQGKLVDVVKMTSDPEMQMSVLRALIRRPSGPLFDMKTNSSTVSSIISHLCAEAAQKLSQELICVLDGHETWIKDRKLGDELKRWAVTHLRVLATTGGAGSYDWQLDLLKYMFCRAFFTATQATSDVPHCGTMVTAMSLPIKQSLRVNFFKTLNNHASFHASGVSKASQINRFLNTAYDIFEYTLLLLEKSEFVRPDEAFSDQVSEKWNNLVSIIRKVDKKRKKNERMGQDHAFELLFLYMAFQLFMSQKEAIDVLGDLHVCYEKAGNKRRKSVSKKENDEPEWIEVTVELILSLMSRGSHLARVVANSVFAALTSHITPKALSLILDVLQTPKGGEVGQLEFEGEDENMEDEENEEEEDVEMDEEGKKNEEEEEESGVSDEEEDMEGEVDENFRKAVKAALGDAAADSDEDEPDLSDSEMFKLDAVLAEAFKSMKRGKGDKERKEKSKLVTDFKLRVLDLLVTLVKNQPAALHAQALVQPLLELMEAGNKNREEKVLGSRASNVFNLLFKTKKITAANGVNREELVKAIQNLIEYSKTVTGVPMVKEVAKGCLLMIRLLLNFESSLDPSPITTRAQSAVKEKKKESKIKDQAYYQNQVIDIVREGLKNVLYTRDHRLSPTFFYTILERYPVFFWPLSDTLVQAVSSDDVRFFCKTQACSILVSIMNRNVVITEEMMMVLERIKKSFNTDMRKIYYQLKKLYVAGQQPGQRNNSKDKKRKHMDLAEDEATPQKRVETETS